MAENNFTSKPRRDYPTRLSISDPTHCLQYGMQTVSFFRDAIAAGHHMFAIFFVALLEGQIFSEGSSSPDVGRTDMENSLRALYTLFSKYRGVDPIITEKMNLSSQGISRAGCIHIFGALRHAYHASTGKQFKFLKFETDFGLDANFPVNKCSDFMTWVLRYFLSKDTKQILWTILDERKLINLDNKNAFFPFGSSYNHENLPEKGYLLAFPRMGVRNKMYALLAVSVLRENVAPFLRAAAQKEV